MLLLGQGADIALRYFQAELFRLLTKKLHEIEAIDAFRNPRIILYQISDGNLTHRRCPFDQQDFEARPGGVDARRKAGRPPANDHHII